MNNINKPTERGQIVALYARVSTGRQENEQTIESQLEEVKKRIVEDGNILPPENIFIDDGWSGELLARPDLDRMRDMAKEGKYRILYVYDRGRLSRTFFHQEMILEELSDREIKFISLHDVQAITPEEKVLQSMQGVFHEYERIKIIERMRRGKLFKARNGIIINGHALYGYNLIRKTEKVPANYVINEDEAGVVRMIWQWFGNERLSVNKIIKRLHDKGIFPRKRKSDIWAKGSITRILKCGTYVTGMAYYNKSESIKAKNPIKHVKYSKVKKSSRTPRSREEWIGFEVPRIINDSALYERILDQIEFNKRYAHSLKKHQYMLSGYLYCNCGSRMAGDGQNKHGHFYYRCSERIKSFPYKSRCQMHGVNANLLDVMLWEKLKKHLFDCTIIKKQAERWVNSKIRNGGNQAQELKIIQGKLDRINEEEKRLAHLYATDNLEMQAFEELSKDLKKRKLLVICELNKLTKYTGHIDTVVGVDELIQMAKKVVAKIDFTNKDRVIRDIITRITVTERDGIEVLAHLPLQAYEADKLEYGIISRDSGVAKCGEVHLV